MVFSDNLRSDRNFKFILNRINCLDQEITRYRDYEWKATSFHTAFFVAILYFLIDPHGQLYLINAIGSIILGFAISVYFIIACYQLIDIHIKLNKKRNKRTKLLKDIGENLTDKEIPSPYFYEGPAAYFIICFIIWLISLFALDLFLLYKSIIVVVMAIVISLILIKKWVTTIFLKDCLIKEHRDMDNNSELLLRLYEKQLDSWNRRRDYEWKITILFWTGAIVSTGFIADKFKFEQMHIFPYIVICVIVLWLAFVFLWLKGVWTANEKDKNWASVYRSRIEAQIGMIREEDVEIYKKPSWSEFIADYSMRFQALFTFVLLILIWYMLYKVGCVAP